MPVSLAGLRTVIYPTIDLQAARSWWSELLGVEPYFDEVFYVGFEVGGYELGLLPDEPVADGVLTYWGVEDVAAAVAAAVASGATIHTPPAEVGDDIVTATVRTPQGPIVGFIYNPISAGAEPGPGCVAMDGELDIRDERAADVDDVDRLVGEAFGGRPNEVALVRGLRAAADPAISRVAASDATIVGHVMVSPLALQGSDARVVGLAPLSVAPASQARGVGSRLVRDVLEVARRAGASMVVVLGDFAYYARFGFEPARARGVDPPPGVSAESLSVVCLASFDAGARRQVVYPDVFRDTGTL